MQKEAGSRNAQQVFVSDKIDLVDTGKYGMGVFARTDIDAGTILYNEGELEQNLYTRQEIINKESSSHYQTYSYVVQSNSFFAAGETELAEDITNFMNHSCSPNAVFDGDRAMRTACFIKAGDEVCCDYATFETEISFHKGMRCHCGSDNCRGHLTGREYRDPVFAKRYAGKMSSYIEELRKGPSYYDERLYVRDGKIGPGVFAMEMIPTGTLLACYSGRLVTGQELRLLSAEELRYNLQINWNLFQIPLSNVRELPDFINHSCDPNAGLYDSVQLIALRDIGEEEEICLDYATFNSGYIKGESDNFECNCQASNCRGQVYSDDYKLKDIQDRLLPYFSPYLKDYLKKTERVK